MHGTPVQSERARGRCRQGCTGAVPGVPVPLVGSVTPKAWSRRAPELSWGRYRCFWSALPCRRSVPMVYICAWQALPLQPERWIFQEQLRKARTPAMPVSSVPRPQPRRDCGAHLLHNGAGCLERQALPAVLGGDERAEEATAGQIRHELGRVRAVAVLGPPVLARVLGAQRLDGSPAAARPRRRARHRAAARLSGAGRRAASPALRPRVPDLTVGVGDAGRDQRRAAHELRPQRRRGRGPQQACRSTRLRRHAASQLARRPLVLPLPRRCRATAPLAVAQTAPAISVFRRGAVPVAAATVRRPKSRERLDVPRNCP